MTSYTGVGLMSGTSLDGLDLCCVEFTGDVDIDLWSHRVIHARTLPYTSNWQERLAGAARLSGLDLMTLHYDYAHYMGSAVEEFIQESGAKVEFVATHGHTVFHQPDKQLTFQLGDGETMVSYLTCPLVTNFRAKDVALGGQGAPLVPSGERFLFSQMSACINLGGIANIGSNSGLAYDICPCNMVLNRLAKKYDFSLDLDRDGQIASRGSIQFDLLNLLENLEYYKQPPPKSLGAEWVEDCLWPLLNTTKYSIPDQMRTFIEHVTNQIVDACSIDSKLQMSSNSVGSERTVLVTGGGYHNTFLLGELKRKLCEIGVKLEDVDHLTVDYKEAIIFAYLGLRSLLGLPNVFCSTTGARADSVAGSVHQPALHKPSTPRLSKQFRFLLRSQLPSPP